MKKIALDKLRGLLIAKTTRLFLLMTIVAVLLMSPLTSFALSSDKAATKNVTVKTTKVVPTPGGKSETILTNAKDLTLYYYKADKGTTSACTGSCLTIWPPLLFTGSGTPSASTKLPGKLAATTNANGKQVSYNGYLLYTYAEDKVTGDIKGNKEGGQWFIVPTNIKPRSSTNSKNTSKSIQPSASPPPPPPNAPKNPANGPLRVG